MWLLLLNLVYFLVLFLWLKQVGAFFGSIFFQVSHFLLFALFHFLMGVKSSMFIMLWQNACMHGIDSTQCYFCSVSFGWLYCFILP